MPEWVIIIKYGTSKLQCQSGMQKYNPEFGWLRNKIIKKSWVSSSAVVWQWHALSGDKWFGVKRGEDQALSPVGQRSRIGVNMDALHLVGLVSNIWKKLWAWNFHKGRFCVPQNTVEETVLIQIFHWRWMSRLFLTRNQGTCLRPQSCANQFWHNTFLENV